MKTTILFLFLVLVSCSKDSSTKDPIFSLPPETQTGANTFGVTINGKVYIPRDPTGINWGGQQGKGMVWSAGGIGLNGYYELKVIDGASSAGFKIVIHIQKLDQNGVGQYLLKNSNFQDQADSVLENHIFFKIWDSNINNYAYYGSIENEGVINITKRSNAITSGNFSGKFVRYDNANEFIQITDGRFDIGPGLYDKVFP